MQMLKNTPILVVIIIVIIMALINRARSEGFNQLNGIRYPRGYCEYIHEIGDFTSLDPVVRKVRAKKSCS
jgi:hypothetical protein